MDVRCSVTSDRTEVAVVSIRPVRYHHGRCDYQVNITIDKGPSIGTHTRLIRDWPYKDLNPIMLLAAALNEISVDMATLEGELVEAGTSDLARQVGRAVSPLPGEADGQLRHH